MPLPIPHIPARAPDALRKRSTQAITTTRQARDGPSALRALPPVRGPPRSTSALLDPSATTQSNQADASQGMKPNNIKARKLPPQSRCSIDHLTVRNRSDLNNLLESFVARQKMNKAQWRPTRQPIMRSFSALPRKQTSPQTRQATHHWRLSCRAIENSASAPLTVNDFRALTTGLVSMGSERFPVESAPSFEAVLRVFFREATEVEIETMVSFAEPTIAWQQRQFERECWCEQTWTDHGDAIRRAFAPLESESDSTIELLVVIKDFAETLALHRLGVDPVAFSAPNLQNLRLLAKLQRVRATEGMRQRELLELADENGNASVEDVLDLVSRQDAVRTRFESIVQLGIARRQNLMNGYWMPKSSRQYNKRALVCSDPNAWQPRSPIRTTDKGVLAMNAVERYRSSHSEPPRRVRFSSSEE